MINEDMLYQTHMHETNVTIQGGRGKKASGEENEDRWRDGTNVWKQEHVPSQESGKRTEEALRQTTFLHNVGPCVALRGHVMG